MTPTRSNQLLALLSPGSRARLTEHLSGQPKRDADVIFARAYDETGKGSEGRRIVTRAWSHIERGA